MKRIALSLIALIFSLGCMAAPVTPNVSRQAAANFWNTYRPTDVKAVAPEQMQLVSVASLPMLHIWAVDNQGFIIMSASDQVKPVLAYSFDSPASREPNPEVMFWLNQYNEQIAAAEASGYRSAEASTQWNDLLTNPVPPTPVNIVVVPKLMQTHWDQGHPYNKFCPYDSTHNARTVVGCVATAMAQIMKYWNHPSSGEGFHSYIPAGGAYDLQAADFAHTTYMWGYMTNNLDQYTAQQRAINAVATISYHCGVAVDMMYGPSATGGSGAYSSCGWWASACAENAFRDYFKYSRNLHYEERNTSVWRDSTAFDTVTMDSINVHYRADSTLISDSVWCAMIDSNLAMGAPMYYDGSDASSGHAFVLDGSDADGKYHFNWGWSGYYDGYYSINNVAPGAGGIGGNATYSFNSSQGAIFAILPLEEHFESATMYDTICNNSNKYYFHDYEFPAADSVYTAVYLDTIYTIHLKVIPTRLLYLNANGGTGTAYEVQFCPVDGVDVPACRFHRADHIFIGWGFDRHTNDTLYQPGDHLSIRGSKTLYAIWQDTTIHQTDPEDSVSITLADEGTLMIAPNPVRDQLSVSLTSDDDITLLIIDQWGRVVVQQKIIGSKAEISLSRLPAGTYTVRVITSKEEYNSRIIKL